MEDTKFRGVPVYMGGREYVMPSLSVRQFRDHYALLSQPIQAESEQETHDLFDRYIPLIGLALRRNYPEITDDELFDLIDLGSFRDVVAALTAASGMRPVKPGEARPVA